MAGPWNVYISDFTTLNIEVISTATNTITTTLSIGTGTAGNYQVDVAPNDNYAVVNNFNQGAANFIVAAGPSAGSTKPIATAGQGVCFTADSSTVYVGGTNFLYYGPTNTNVVTGSIQVETSGAFEIYEVHCTPDGTKILATSNRGVYIIHTATKTLSTTLAIGLCVGLAISPDGTTAYACQETVGTGNIIAIINVATETQTGSITVPGSSPFPAHVCFDPTGTFAYCTNLGTSTICKIQVSTSSVVATLSSGSINSPECIAITPDNASLYVPCYAGNLVAVISVATFTLLTTIPVPSSGHLYGVGIVPGSITPPPTTLTVGNLFIPRKGFSSTHTPTPSELVINWHAIEDWANTAWKPVQPFLFIPSKDPSNYPTPGQLSQNWRAIENWAKAIGTVNTNVVRPLFIPRKSSLAPNDLNISFLAIQLWANSPITP